MSRRDRYNYIGSGGVGGFHSAGSGLSSSHMSNSIFGGSSSSHMSNSIFGGSSSSHMSNTGLGSNLTSNSIPYAQMGRTSKAEDDYIHNDANWKTPANKSIQADLKARLIKGRESNAQGDFEREANIDRGI
jgi:hypothetical protein